MKKDQLSIWIEKSLKQWFKVYCTQQELSMQDVVTGFIAELQQGRHAELIERLKRDKK